ncbi:hypothetical protein H9635_13500 [Solibacillus sp. A46]|uniref:Uncharacterized protein n=1 Tax=Solibacillus faecavium TaxID=2762221 RepID=A0ABR8Y0P1_9BACL|nr:hypothetical protein [Solibacillus faecavium]MBD8037761.1 hypothetical protein [Solibacillus faecavium]
MTNIRWEVSIIGSKVAIKTKRVANKIVIDKIFSTLDGCNGEGVANMLM